MANPLLDAPVGAGPAGAYALALEGDGRKADHRGDEVENPERHRIPDGIDEVAQDAVVVAPVDVAADQQLQHARHEQQRAVPAREGFEAPRRRHVDKEAQHRPGDDEQHVVRPHHRQRVLDKDRPHHRLAQRQHGRRVLDQRLDAALGPAQPLLVEAAEGLGHQDPRQRARLVADDPAAHLQLPADVDVFGEHVVAPVAHLFQRMLAEHHHHARHRQQPAVHLLGALDQADDGRELAHLHAPQQRGARADARVARHRADGRVLQQVPDHPGDGIHVQDRIAVDAHQVLGIGHLGGGGQADRLALVGRLVDHHQLRIPVGQLIQALAGAVAAAVVDGDDDVVGIAHAGQVADHLPHVGLLVVAGHDDRHPGVVLPPEQNERIPYPLRAPLQQEEVQQPADHPEVRHEERVVENKARNPALDQ